MTSRMFASPHSFQHLLLPWHIHWHQSSFAAVRLCGFHYAGPIDHLDKVIGFTGPLVRCTAWYRTILGHDESAHLHYLCLHLCLATLGPTFALVGFPNVKVSSDSVLL